MKNYGYKYFDNIEYLKEIEKDQVIAEGDGDFITEVANQVSGYFDYNSMWLFTDSPILKPNRAYLLWFDGNYLTVSRNFKTKHEAIVKERENEL